MHSTPCSMLASRFFNTAHRGAGCAPMLRGLAPGCGASRDVSSLLFLSFSQLFFMTFCLCAQRYFASFSSSLLYATRCAVPCSALCSARRKLDMTREPDEKVTRIRRCFALPSSNQLSALFCLLSCFSLTLLLSPTVLDPTEIGTSAN